MSRYEIGAYYFPNFHEDERNNEWHGKGWTEWELVRQATPRFEGHCQPKVPMWGYEDESDPAVMEKKIAAAADSGLTSFVFDWYWYEDGGFLQDCLEKGFLKARNNDRLKFALMWANHDWTDIHPASRSVQKHPILQAAGKVSPKGFYEATEYIIENYFTHPSYWRVDGGLYFSIYVIADIVHSFSDMKRAREAIDDFRERVRARGLGEINLNGVVWGQQILPGDTMPTDANVLLRELGFDSVTSYIWIHHDVMSQFPFTDYAQIRKKVEKQYREFEKTYCRPYYPNVTMGWDPSPRTVQTDRYDNLGYPFTPIMSNNTPQEFEKALVSVKEYLDESPLKTKVFLINAWNEWTEGSYLEPDAIHQMGYLNAVRKVFG